MFDFLFNLSFKGCNVYMSVIKNGVGLIIIIKRNIFIVFLRDKWKLKCDELESLSGCRKFL